jgi:trimeric autotransporter adhesin
MSKARDLANAGTALTTVSATELGYLDGATSTVATINNTQTLTNKTLTAPAINNSTSTGSILIAPEERTTVSATAATGTVNFDAVTQGVLYYTTNASANWTLNVRGSSGATLSSILAVGDAITVSFLVTNGSTAYYQTAFNIDGSVVTPKYSGGTAPSSGNASSIDAYSFTIIKTAATPTYTVFGAGPIKYA